MVTDDFQWTSVFEQRRGKMFRAIETLEHGVKNKLLVQKKFWASEREKLIEFLMVIFQVVALPEPVDGV